MEKLVFEFCKTKSIVPQANQQVIRKTKHSRQRLSSARNIFVNVCSWFPRVTATSVFHLSNDT